MSNGLLLDTCAAIWLAEGEPLTPESRSEIRSAVQDARLNVSVFVAWEVGLLAKRNRRAFFAPPSVWFSVLSRTPGLNVVGLTPDILIESHDLPDAAGSDPVDRIMIATANRLALTLVTRDKRIISFGERGHVSVLAC